MSTPAESPRSILKDGILGIPIERPDGREVTITQAENERLYVTFSVGDGDVVEDEYKPDLITRLGEGEFNRGVARILGAYCAADLNTHAGATQTFLQLIERGQPATNG